MSTIRSKYSLRPAHSILLMGLFTFVVRLYLNFSTTLLVGNGGYYPLQVRTLLERGELAFSDMPFLFYLDAAVVKLVSLFGVTISNELILNTVKFMDAFLFSLIAIPCYYLVREVSKKMDGTWLVAISGYLMLSFIPLSFLGSFQKNAFAIVLLFAALLLSIRYQRTKNRNLWIGACFLVLLIGLTHFGTFMFALLSIATFLMVRYRWKAALPIIGVSALGIGWVFLFDSDRGHRIVEFFSATFSGNALLAGHILPSLLKWTFYAGTAFLAIRFMRKQWAHFSRFDRAIIWTAILLLIFVPLPVYDGQFSSRLSNFLFLAQGVLLIYFASYLRRRPKRVLTVLLLLITLGSLGITLVSRPPMDVPEEAHASLKTLKVDDPEQTIIVARHNLEFWVAWELGTKVSQEKEFNVAFFEKYEHVFVLNQTKGMQHHPHRDAKKKDPFSEPEVPKDARLIDSSDYFVLYELKPNVLK